MKLLDLSEKILAQNEGYLLPRITVIAREMLRDLREASEKLKDNTSVAVADQITQEMIATLTRRLDGNKELVIQQLKALDGKTVAGYIDAYLSKNASSKMAQEIKQTMTEVVGVADSPAIAAYKAKYRHASPAPITPGSPK